MYRRILLPTDGSACSERAVAHGLELARRMGAEVTVLHAIENPMQGYAAEGLAYLPQIHEEMQRAGEELLARWQERAEEAGVMVRTRLVEAMPADAVHEAEAEHDLVVMGTHGRRGLSRWMFGSVAEAALRRAGVPYLLVRGGDEEDEGDARAAPGPGAQ